MVMLIKNTDEYLYEKKRDLLILEIRHRESGRFSIDRENQVVKNIGDKHIKWFDERGIKTFHTCPTGLLCGWMGHYYFDIDTRSSIIEEYSKEFENDQGQSLHPEEYQMFILNYDEWVNNGSLAKHEQYLIDREDPNWEY